MALMSTFSHSIALHRAQRLSLMDVFSLARQRRALASLDTRALKDLGITREEALKEANRSVWDVPNYWAK